MSEQMRPMRPGIVTLRKILKEMEADEGLNEELRQKASKLLTKIPKKKVGGK